MALEPTTYGYDNSFFKKLTVSNLSFNETPDVFINIKWQHGLILSNDGYGIVEYSFNGNTVHGELDGEVFQFDNRRIAKIWFRLLSGTDSVVKVMAWG